MLVIEDEPIISDKIVEKLTSFIDSRKIKLANSVQDSFNLLDTFKFEIIILDLNLIDGNGITILNKIKEDHIDALVYVFSINSELKNMCLKKGATAFFDKSTDFDNLISTVKTAYQNIFNEQDSVYTDNY